MTRVLLGLASAIGVGLIATAAQAQDLSVKPPPEAESGVGFSITPYLWLTSISGTVAALPGNITPTPGHEVDASFLDIAPSLEGAFMMKAELGFGRWGIIGDVSWASIALDVDAKFTEANIAHSEADIESLQSTVALRYRMIDDPGGTTLDLVGGARISYAELKVNLTVLNTTFSGDASDTWVDPIIGIRGRKPIGEKWAITGYADVGGFGVSSDFTGQVIGTFDYHSPGSRWNFGVGYRYYKVDYENLPMKLDLAMYGPILGASFRF